MIAGASSDEGSIDVQAPFDGIVGTHFDLPRYSVRAARAGKASRICTGERYTRQDLATTLPCRITRDQPNNTRATGWTNSLFLTILYKTHSVMWPKTQALTHSLTVYPLAGRSIGPIPCIELTAGTKFLDRPVSQYQDGPVCLACRFSGIFPEKTMRLGRPRPPLLSGGEVLVGACIAPMAVLEGYWQMQDNTDPPALSPTAI